MFLLITVVTLGSLVLMGALIPAVVHAYGIDDQNVWRISSGLVFVLNLVILLATHLTTRGFKFAHHHRRLTSVSVWILEPAFQLPLVINVLGWNSHMAQAFHTTALLVALLQGLIILFDLVVTSLLVEAE